MRRSLVALAAVAAVVTPAMPATAATRWYVAAVAYQFAPADFPTVAGDHVTLVNLDNDAHDITSIAPGPVEGHLFYSGVVDARGETTDVAGVSDLAGGIYEFYCSVHPEMRGSILVQ